MTVALSAVALAGLLLLFGSGSRSKAPSPDVGVPNWAVATGLLLLEDYLTIQPSMALTPSPSGSAEGPRRDEVSAAAGRAGFRLPAPEAEAGTYQFVEILVPLGSWRVEEGWWVGGCARLVLGSAGGSPSRLGRCLAVLVDGDGRGRAVASLGISPAPVVVAGRGPWQRAGPESLAGAEAGVKDLGETVQLARAYLSPDGALVGFAHLRAGSVRYEELLCLTGSGRGLCLPFSVPVPD